MRPSGFPGESWGCKGLRVGTGAHLLAKGGRHIGTGPTLTSLARQVFLSAIWPPCELPSSLSARVREPRPWPPSTRPAASRVSEAPPHPRLSQPLGPIRRMVWTSGAMPGYLMFNPVTDHLLPVTARVCGAQACTAHWWPPQQMPQWWRRKSSCDVTFTINILSQHPPAAPCSISKKIQVLLPALHPLLRVTLPPFLDLLPRILLTIL